ncbi:TraM recognition domain-containing protein, partial [Staphylococcus aureus]|uniref:TraM recognition domain-containing protein n=1 Tax=Staphylococcus aureus TaxID=1280 RepID=UPI0011F2259B
TAAILYMEFEARVREAMYELSDEHDRQGLPRPMPLTFVNDEGLVAPPSQLGNLLAEMRDRGVLFIMSVQSLEQAHLIFGDLAKSFMTLFRTVLVFRYVRDVKTLETLSTLCGTHWQQVVSYSHGTGSGGPNEGMQRTLQQVPNLYPHQ